MNAEEFARLKHEVETRQASVDQAFGTLDDFSLKHDMKAGRNSSAWSAGMEAEEKVVLLERLMEAMSRLNASYRDYVQALEKEIGF